MSFEEVKALCEGQQFDEAIALAAKHLNHKPDDSVMLYMASRAMSEKGMSGLAKPLALQAATLSPKSWEAWNLLGKTQSDVWELEEARESFRLALQLYPTKAAPLANMAMTDYLRGNTDSAVRLARKALEADPECMNTRNNLGMFLLSQGDWSGWKHYECGLGNHYSRRERVYGDEPRWNGEKDKTVIAYGEQGIGDEISFASCIPDLIRDSKKVIIDCDNRLEGLFKRSFPEAEVHGTRFRDVDLTGDYRVAFGSLPKCYRRKDADFTGNPYLIADPERRKQWRVLLDELPGLKVGLAWNAGTSINGQKFRSIDLEDMKPILQTKGVSFVSLEYRDPTKEIEEVSGVAKIHEWGRATRTLDYDDTAALVAELDLVITVGTAVAHLCGGLGKECWVLLQKNPIWRYRGGDTTPWYRSVRFYRQRTDWTYPVHRVAEDLRARL